MNASKHIKLGALISYFSIAFNIIAGLIYTPWMINQIGKSDYGLYTLANSLITLFLVDFGLGQAVSRYVSKYRAEGNEEKVNNFLGVIYKLYFIIDAVILILFVAVFLMLEAIYVKLTPGELEKFKIVYIIAASSAVMNFPFVTLNGILSSFEKFVPLKLADLLCKVITIAITVAALLFGGGIYELVAAHAIAGIITIVFKLISVKIYTPVKVNFGFSDKRLLKDILGFSVWVTISLLAQRLIFNITPTILGIVASTSAIAVFGVVTTIEGYTYTITSAINGMFLPRISRIYATGDSDKNLMPLLLSVGKFQFALNSIIIVGFAVVGRMFIRLWLGPDYMDAYWGVLLVIIPGLFFNSLQIGNTAMVVQKKVHLQAYIALISGAINVVLSFILSYYWGIVGASLSIFIAYMFRAFATNIVCYKKMGLDIPRFAKECYIKMSIPLIITIILGLLINCVFTSEGWIVLIVESVIIVLIYVFLLLFLGLNKKERELVLGKIKER